MSPPALARKSVAKKPTKSASTSSNATTAKSARAPTSRSSTVAPKSTSSVREPNVVTLALGRSLKEWRFKRNLSQEQLAEAAAIDRTFISLVERGGTNPTLFSLSHICSALNITLSELFAPIRENIQPPGIGKAGVRRRANAPDAELTPYQRPLR